ncbi:SAVED domain-containing protein [Alienimonas sp. DA493]|uniref:SAVED domain-containing protein n=1 Tax=Alienimonas sp. DA493 TaxID=3373605 RepID=UPI00375540D3
MSISSIPAAVRCCLWGRAAGRCQYDGCNERLDLDLLTNHRMNRAFLAHFVADSPDGPRGHPELSERLKSDIDNLMLLCADHHKLIDVDEVETHPVERLTDMKRRHEERIALATAVRPERQSHVLLYGAKIGAHDAPLGFRQAAEAMVPDRYPAENRAIELGLKNAVRQDDESGYWQNEVEHLRRQFARKVEPRLESDVRHLSIFGLAPMPLLIELGRLLSDLPAADVHQLHREPPGWYWNPPPSDFSYQVVAPAPTTVAAKSVALVIALSAPINRERVAKAVGGDAAVWTITHDDPRMDFLRSREQLSQFRDTLRSVYDRIKTVYGEDAALSVFPAAPVSAAIEIGRVWMPKAHLPFRVFDQNQAKAGFHHVHTVEQ